MPTRDDKSSQDWLIKPMQSSNIASDVDIGGICGGYAYRCAEHSLSTELEYVFQIADTLYEAGGNITIESLKNNIDRNSKLLGNVDLSSKELQTKIHDDQHILAFLETIYTHQVPSKIKELKKAKKYFQDIQLTSSYLAPQRLKENNGMKHVETISGAYLSEELDSLLTSLKNELNKEPKIPHPFTMILEGSEHAININYDSSSGYWFLFDANQEPIMTKSIFSVSEYCIDAFFESEKAMFTMQIKATQNSFDSIKEKVEGWKSSREYKKVQAVDREKAQFRISTGETLLHLASAHNELQLMDDLIHHGANVNAQMKNELTPFMASLGNQAASEKLIKAKADVRLGNILGLSPFYVAGYLNDKNLISTLIRNQTVKGRMSGLYDMSALAWGSLQRSAGVNLTAFKKSLYMAAANGNMAKVKKHLKKGAKIDKIYETTGNTPLHIAIINNHPDVVAQLIKHKRNLNFLNEDGHTPLMVAAKLGRLDIVESLISTSKFKINESAGSNTTALIIAAENGNLEIVKVLLAAGANLNAVNHSQDNALLVAIANHRDEVAQFLIRQGIDLKVPEGKSSPLKLATEKNSLATKLELLAALGKLSNDPEVLSHLKKEMYKDDSFAEFIAKANEGSSKILMQMFIEPYLPKAAESKKDSAKSSRSEDGPEVNVNLTSSRDSVLKVGLFSANSKLSASSNITIEEHKPKFKN